MILWLRRAIHLPGTADSTPGCSDAARVPLMLCEGGGEEGADFFYVDGLDHVVVDAGGAGTGAILLLAVAGDGDDEEVCAAGFGAEAAGDFVAIHEREADVEQDGGGEEDGGFFEGGGAVVGELDGEAAAGE